MVKSLLKHCVKHHVLSSMISYHENLICIMFRGIMRTALLVNLPWKKLHHWQNKIVRIICRKGPRYTDSLLNPQGLFNFNDINTYLMEDSCIDDISQVPKIFNLYLKNIYVVWCWISLFNKLLKRVTSIQGLSKFMWEFKLSDWLIADYWLISFVGLCIHNSCAMDSLCKSLLTGRHVAKGDDNDYKW